MSVRRFDLDVGVTIRPVAGEAIAGDVHGAFHWERGTVLTLADGLGHGPRAAVAARAFVRAVEESAAGDLPTVLANAHKNLVKTRGAVGAIARFDETAGNVEIASIGNIATFVVTGGERVTHSVSMPGVVGGAFRTVRPERFDFAPGDLLVMVSDGVRRFEIDRLVALSAAELADEVIRSHAKTSDDAACIVARAAPPKNRAERAELSASATGAGGPLVLAVRHEADGPVAAAEARRYAASLGFSLRAQWEVSIVVSELATNILKYAKEGSLALKRLDGPRPGLEVVAADRGPGIDDVAAACIDGVSEGARITPDRHPRRGLGVGLGTVHRLMDQVRFETEPGAGTRVIAQKFHR